MLVKFISSESGELLMFAEVACQILSVLDKECSARGVFTLEEMLPAAERLRKAVAKGAGKDISAEDADGEQKPGISQRAWPFIDMLERSAKGGSRANILWEAAQDFGARSGG